MGFSDDSDEWGQATPESTQTHNAHAGVASFW